MVVWVDGEDYLNIGYLNRFDLFLMELVEIKVKFLDDENVYIICEELYWIV